MTFRAGLLVSKMKTLETFPHIMNITEDINTWLQINHSYICYDIESLLIMLAKAVASSQRKNDINYNAYTGILDRGLWQERCHCLSFRSTWDHPQFSYSVRAHVTLVCCVVFCWSSFVHCIFVLLRFMVSDTPFVS